MMTSTDNDYTYHRSESLLFDDGGKYVVGHIETSAKLLSGYIHEHKTRTVITDFSPDPELVFKMKLEGKVYKEYLW